MNESREQQRNRRKPGLTVDALEDRRVMSAGMGNTFAIVTGELTEASKPSAVEVRLDATHFTPGARGRVVVGIDVAADPATSVQPQVTSIRTAAGRNVGITRSKYSQSLVSANKLTSPNSTAVTTTLQVPRAGQAPNSYKVEVRGLTADTGKYLLGFYLPGDVDGDGVVSKTDLQTMASKFGQTSSDDGYSFDADSNRDGKIDAKDLRIATMNMGAKTIISPVASVNLDPASDTGISDRITDQRVVKFIGAASPNANVTFAELNGNSPGGAVVAGPDGKYTVDVQLGDGSNTFKVTSADAFGQSITGAISPVTFKLNPPTVTNTLPSAANAKA